jgi:hypothetical protein
MSGAPPPASAKEARAAALEAHNKAARQALMARPAKNTDADLAQNHAEAVVAARHAAPPAVRSLGAKLPRAARVALDPRDRVFNPKILEADVKRFDGRPCASIGRWVTCWRPASSWWRR